jgi:hypothetical protein
MKWADTFEEANRQSPVMEVPNADRNLNLTPELDNFIAATVDGAFTPTRAK